MNGCEKKLRSISDGEVGDADDSVIDSRDCGLRRKASMVRYWFSGPERALMYKEE